jgi:hypothetical protein
VRHLAVDVAIPQIIDDTAGRAHRQAADGEQGGQPDGLGDRRMNQQDAPKSWKEQQPGADRPVHAGQKQVGQPGAGQPGNPAGDDDVRVHDQGVCSPIHGFVNPS